MTRLRILLLSLVLVLVAATSWAAVATFEGYPTVRVLLNGQPVTSDVPPINFNGRTLVPLRAIAEALGLEVGWDADTQTVTLSTVAPVSPTATTTQTSNVPSSPRDVILKSIKARAEKEWPGDYRMQAYEYEKQVAAFDELAALSDVEGIKTRAVEEWPGDYRMQLYEYKKQLSAYQKLQSVPGR